jgi:ubiquinone/menaquinone biosynthesis C-methylase UbiE
MLHVAPERHFANLFPNIPGVDYLSADLNRPMAMVKMDITDIQYPDNSFDVIYCSHVLEHIPDDHRAMSELFRVLKPGGWAILQVPQADLDVTYEDFSITDPAEREKHFGQYDHVRWYGRDYKDRLVRAGFQVTEDHIARELDPADAKRFGLMVSENVYLCRK